MNLTPAVRELIANVSEPFERARAMPPSVYTSPEFLERELKDIFAREWVTVGRADALKKPGDYITYELAGQPIFVVRDNDGVLRAMSNVCLHRMSTLLEGTGNKRVIVCPYRRCISTASSARSTTGCRRCGARSGSAGSW
jgi:choline monooxygenase